MTKDEKNEAMNVDQETDNEAMASKDHEADQANAEKVANIPDEATKEPKLTAFEQSVLDFTENPTDETSAVMHKAGFAAVNDGIHTEEFVVQEIQAVTPMHKSPADSIMDPPFNFTSHAIEFTKAMAFAPKDGEANDDGDIFTQTTEEAVEALSAAIDNARGLLEKGIKMPAGIFSWTDRIGTPEETCLMELSQAGFVFPSNVPMNALAQRLLMMMNENLAETFGNYFQKGYTAGCLDTASNEKIMQQLHTMIKIAEHSKRPKDKKRVATAKGILDQFVNEG